MESLSLIVETLSSRLPELEWKLTEIPAGIFQSNRIPKHLFRQYSELTATSCIAEIKHDLHRLEQQTGFRTARYLAESISHKINALIRLCKDHARKDSAQGIKGLKLHALTTRDEWVDTLKSAVKDLERQRAALQKTLSMLPPETEQAKKRHSIREELAKVEQRLQTVRESLQRASGLASQS